MEELLRKLKIQSPPPDLRERVLAAARAELLRAPGSLLTKRALDNGGINPVLQKLGNVRMWRGTQDALRLVAQRSRECAGEQPLVDRLWESWTFWYSLAATVLLCLGAIFASGAGSAGSTGEPPRQVIVASPEVIAAAHDLAQMLGDGPTLERRFAAMLTGPATSAERGPTVSELRRTLQ